jgi:hypothetical protein
MHDVSRLRSERIPRGEYETSIAARHQNRSLEAFILFMQLCKSNDQGWSAGAAAGCPMWIGTHMRRLCRRVMGSIAIPSTGDVGTREGQRILWSCSSPSLPAEWHSRAVCSSPHLQLSSHQEARNWPTGGSLFSSTPPAWSALRVLPILQRRPQLGTPSVPPHMQ